MPWSKSNTAARKSSAVNIRCRSSEYLPAWPEARTFGKPPRGPGSSEKSDFQLERGARSWRTRKRPAGARQRLHWQLAARKNCVAMSKWSKPARINIESGMTVRVQSSKTGCTRLVEEPRLKTKLKILAASERSKTWLGTK